MGSHVVGEIAGNAIGTAVALAGIGKSAADKIKEDAGAQLASAGRDALNSKAGGAVQMAAGGAVLAAGVPLLILPGPGIAVMAGGAAIAARGAKRVLGKKEARRS